MRRHIQVSTDEPVTAEGAPELAPDEQAPDIGDHVNPSQTFSPETAATDGDSARKVAEDGPRGDSGAEAYITALQAELEDVRARAEDAEKKLLYLQSDYVNYRRRRDEEQAGLMKYANGELIKSLLPVLDNLERALKAAEQTKSFDALIGGVSGTLRQLSAALEKAGVKSIESVGKEFDPNIHEAIGHTESAEYPAHTVAEEVQRGYTLHDRVLRPALVKVAGE